MKLVLYVGGGAMSAVFSAGVLEELRALGAEKRISAVHAVSAGAFNAAIFITGQHQQAVSWYTNLVREHGIIRTRNPWKVIRGEDAIDLDEVERAMRKEAILDVESLVNSSIPFYVKVTKVESEEAVYLDAHRQDVLKLLRASATIVPFAGKPVVLDGVRYVDGAMSSPIGIDALRKIYPGAQFLVILNSSFTVEAAARYLLWVVGRARDEPLVKTYIQALMDARKEFLLLQNAPDVLLLAPPEDYAVNLLTEEEKLMKKGYQLGRDCVKNLSSRIEDFWSDCDK